MVKKYTYSLLCQMCSKSFIGNKKTDKYCGKICMNAGNALAKCKFTTSEIEEMTELRLSGMIWEEIGKKMNLSPSSIKSFLLKKGVKLTQEQANENIARRWVEYNPWINGTQLKCTTCEEIKEKEEFNLRIDSASGHTTICTQCINQYNADYYLKNAPEIKESSREYQLEHKEEISEKNKKAYEENPQPAIERAGMFAKNNPEKVKEYSRKSGKKHQKSKNARTAQYRSKKKSAMPVWISELQIEEMKNIYKNCPIGHQIDHIIPLNGQTVSGLHVPWNLIAIPSSVNGSKSNKLIQDNNVYTCSQYVRRLETQTQDIADGKTFGLNVSDFVLSNEKYDSSEHKPFIEKYEWLGTIGFNVKYVFTARYKGDLAGVIIMSEPSGRSTVFGNLESLIQRGACSSWAPKNLNSKLVMFACNWMVDNTDKRVFTGYSDFEAGEIGTIYQACNFTYMGNHFGSNHSYKLPDGKYVTSRYFTKTSSMRRWAKELDIKWEKEWLNDKKFINPMLVPVEIYEKLKQYGKEKMLQCERVDEAPKGKYAIIIGKNRREEKQLKKTIKISSFPYPKRAKEVLPKAIKKSMTAPFDAEYTINGNKITLKIGEIYEWEE